MYSQFDEVKDTPKTYEELINEGKLLLQTNARAASKCFELAERIIDDKYELCHLQAQASRITDCGTSGIIRWYFRALDHIYDQKDRLLFMINEFEKLKLNNISFYLHSLIKEIDPDYEHAVPQTYEDYEKIRKEFQDNNELIYPQSKIYDILISLSQNKTETLLQVAELCAKAQNANFLAEYYCYKALQLQKNKNDKYDTLIRIGDIKLRLHGDLATRAYEQALILKPDAIWPRVKIARQKFYHHQQQDALWDLQKLKFPHDRQIYLELGLLYNEMEVEKEGLEYLLQAIELSPNQFETLLELIHHWAIIFNVKIKLIEMALEINGNNLEILILYAQYLCEKKQQKTQETLDVINKILELDPKQYDYYIYKTEILISLDRKAEAIQELIKVVSIYPSKLTNQLCKLLIEDNQIEEAIRYLKIPLDLEASYEFYCTAVLLFEKNLFQECIQICEEFKDIHLVLSYEYQVKSFIKLNKIQEAIESARKGAELANERELIKFGALLLQIQQLEEAIKYFRKAIEKVNQGFMYEEAANSLFQNNYFQECIIFCDDQIQLDNGEFWEPFQLKVKSLIALKRQNEALQILEKVVQLERFKFQAPTLLEEVNEQMKIGENEQIEKEVI